MCDKWQRCPITVFTIIVILATLVENRSYNNGLIFYDAQARNTFLPPIVSVSRGRSLASVKYSSKGSIWSTLGKPCECSGAICGCCAGIRVKQFEFDQKMCANVTFLAKKREAILDVYLNKAPSSRYGISARNPSPLCIPVMLPIPMAMCVQMSDIAIKGNNLHMCMDFVVRLATTDFFEMHFQCMQMGLDGVQYLDKTGKPVIPMSTKSQTTSINNQQSKEGEQQYDEDDEESPSENEVDSNENKVEQNDYEEEENEELPNDEIEAVDTVAEEIEEEIEENADDVIDAELVDEDTKVIENDADDAQSSTIAESATNVAKHEKLAGNATLASNRADDMLEIETAVNVATTTTTLPTISTTTATNAASNNVEVAADVVDKIVAAVTEKVNATDANEDKDNDNDANNGEQQSVDEDDDDDEADDDESDDEGSVEHEEDTDEEDDDDDEDDADDEDEDDVEVNNNANAVGATKIITGISNSNAQLQPAVKRIPIAVASISLPFPAASVASAGILTEETSSKRHPKLLNYRRARG